MTTESVLHFTPRFLVWQDYATLAVYFAVNLGIGWWWSRHPQSSSRFFLGNRKIGWVLAAVSFFATGTSSISFMALPARTYQYDWLSFGSAPAQTLAGLVVGLFLVRILRRLNITTVYGYLQRRFDRRVQLLGAGLGVLLKIGGRVSVVMLLPSLALSTVTGLNVYLCIGVMGVVTTVYAIEGGFEAVIWTDVLQVIVTYGGVILALGCLVARVDGGLAGIVHVGNEAGKFQMVSWEPTLTKPTGWVFIGMFLGHIFTQLADQPLMQRMLATADEHEARRTVVTGNLIGLSSSILFFFVGTSLYVFYRAHPERLASALPNDAIFPYFIANELPHGAVGLVVAGLFSAAMGTLSGTINATAAIIVTDFQGVLQPLASDAQRLRTARLSTLACGVVGTGVASYLAWHNVPSLWDVFLKLVAVVGGGFPGVFALGLLTRRASSSGVIIGTLASIGVTWAVQHFTDTNVFFHSFVAVGSCMLIGYVASLLLPERSKESGVPDQR